jgi:hypothetical protein
MADSLSAELKSITGLTSGFQRPAVAFAAKAQDRDERWTFRASSLSDWYRLEWWS